MGVQLVVIFIVLFSAFIIRYLKNFENNAEVLRKTYIIFISVILILQSSLRNIAVGPDTFQYSEMFYEDILLNWRDIFQNFVDVYIYYIGRDPGYPLIVKLFSVISTDYRFFLFLIAVFFFLSFAHFIYVNTRSIWEAVFAFILYQALFYSFFSITGIRQTIATAITFWCFELIKKNKFIPFLILILIASSIHKSVLVFIPFYFLANIDRSRQIYILSFILFPIIVVTKQVFAYTLAVASAVENYMHYVELPEKAGTPTFTILLLLVVFLGWFFMKQTLEKYPDSFRIFNAIAIAFVLTPLTWVEPNFMRVVQYFSIFMLIFIPKILNSINFKPQSFRLIIYMFMYLLLIVLIIKTGAEYKFLWQEMPLGENYD
ncbi:MAG: EpsG family protein [Paludibacter sp.]|nr:EpsG family protein [Paludibacter sp.]